MTAVATAALAALGAGGPGPVSTETTAKPTPQTLGAQCPPRTVPERWGATDLSRTKVLALLAPTPPGLSRPERQALNVRRRGLGLLVGWLEDHPGRSWQQRWVATGSEDETGSRWADLSATWLERRGEPATTTQLQIMTSSLALLIVADVVRPSIRWLLTGGKNRKLASRIVGARDPTGFEQLHRCCENDPEIGPGAHWYVASRCAMVLAAKGGTLCDITVGDILEVIDVEHALRGQAASGSATVKVLREMGIFSPHVPTLRELRSAGQPTVEELVDRYAITCRPVRNLLVDYLKERQAVLDHNTLYHQCWVLARRFWADLEAHHPGIDTLALPPSVATAWKQRLRTKTATVTTSNGERVQRAVERLSYLDDLATVRAFYLDLAQWALDDPGRWGPWAAPCPIRPEELARRKQLRQRKARMDARTRERLPALGVLIGAVDTWRRDAEALLAAGRQVGPGESFSAGGQSLVRSARRAGNPHNVWVERDGAKRPRLLNLEEQHAFFAWAVVHVLRLTGIRVEELLELSHHALVQYRMPTSGEVVPLLQIAPSKSDAERLLVVSPELAEVLSAVITRVRDDTGAVPLVRARDHHERVWMAAKPLLFQHRRGAERHAFNVGRVATLLDEALAHTNLMDADRRPLHFSPHDFRRMFITDAVMNGLPPHIAQVIAGHQDINVTMRYKAVYPEEAISAHLAFLARRRALRPSEEYRTPTDEEWQEILGHFERRKVSIGTCARAFGTPCIHEHACVRCPMLWPDPAQRSRLVEIADNLSARIEEAEREGWLGEVDGLQVSLFGARNKLSQIDRHTGTRAVELLPAHR